MNLDKLNLENVRSVLSNVNYTDLPIIALFIYHIIEFSIAIYISKTKFHRSLMFAYCIFFFVYGPTIQQYCKSNYSKLYFSKDYFDDEGIFLFIFFQFPTILSGIVLVIGLLIDYINLCKGKSSNKKQVQSNEKGTQNKNEVKSKND